MNNVSQKIIGTACLLALTVLVANDVRPHFDKSLIELKRKNQSPQRDWSLFYGQQYIYSDGSFRYQNDFDVIAMLIEPNSLYLSDISTSYYLAAHLPAYIKNIHRHHGRSYDASWNALLRDRTVCYLQDPKNIAIAAKFFSSQNDFSSARGLPEIRYIVVNKDRQNINLRQDCLWATRERLINRLSEVSMLRYEGDNLNLYEIKR